MRSRLAYKQVMALTLAAALVLGAVQAAIAAEGRLTAKLQPEKGGKRGHVVVAGIVASVSDDGLLLVVDRGEKDDDATDDIAVQLTDETKIAPKDADVAEGARVRVVARLPEDEGAPLVAVTVVVKRQAEPGVKPPETGRHARPVKGCGIISELPEANEDGDLFGEWVLEVPGLAAYRFVVNETTKIVPPDVVPEIDGRACFQATKADDEWVARLVQLKAKPQPSHRKGATKIILHGTMVGDPPADLTSEWSLEIELRGGGTKSLVVRPDTEIEGQLADGVVLTVHATEEADASGAKMLVAEKIKVAELDEDETGQAKGAVRFVGTVSAAAADVWTISTDSGDLAVTIDDETRIIGLDEGADPVGREVSGHAHRSDDGDLVARFIKFETD